MMLIMLSNQRLTGKQPEDRVAVGLILHADLIESGQL